MNTKPTEPTPIADGIYGLANGQYLGHDGLYLSEKAAMGSHTPVYCRTRMNQEPEKFHEEAIEKMRAWIREWFQPRKTMNNRFSSYALKHWIQNDKDVYLTNGEFIFAMIMEGYQYKISHASSGPHHNCFFNVDTNKYFRFKRWGKYAKR